MAEFAIALKCLISSGDVDVNPAAQATPSFALSPGRCRWSFPWLQPHVASVTSRSCRCWSGSLLSQRRGWVIFPCPQSLIKAIIFVKPLPAESSRCLFSAPSLQQRWVRLCQLRFLLREAGCLADTSSLRLTRSWAQYPLGGWVSSSFPEMLVLGAQDPTCNW